MGVKNRIMNTQIYSIEDIKVKIKPLFEKYGLIKASVFGSYTRKEAMPDSDVDLLVYLDESFELEKYLKFETALKRALNEEG